MVLTNLRHYKVHATNLQNRLWGAGAKRKDVPRREGRSPSSVCALWAKTFGKVVPKHRTRGSNPLWAKTFGEVVPDTERGARTLDHGIKSPALYRLS